MRKSRDGIFSLIESAAHLTDSSRTRLLKDERVRLFSFHHFLFLTRNFTRRADASRLAVVPTWDLDGNLKSAIA